jgi:hypothetical protein
VPLAVSHQSRRRDAAAEAVLTFDDALAREVERLGLTAG